VLVVTWDLMTSSHVWALETGFSRLERTEMRDWGFSSVEEHLPAKCKALNLVPSTRKKKKKERKNRKKKKTKKTKKKKKGLK
jgi:hypothetical protein